MHDYRSEVQLVRMEARQMPLESEDDRTFDWSISIDVSQPELVLITGHLFRIGTFGIGQALSVLFIMDDRVPDNRPEELSYIEWAEATGQVEALYDSCRRSISVQASLMDFDPELPRKAPEHDIQLSSED